jgi:hypothetical protein
VISTEKLATYNAEGLKELKIKVLSCRSWIPTSIKDVVKTLKEYVPGVVSINANIEGAALNDV